MDILTQGRDSLIPNYLLLGRWWKDQFVCLKGDEGNSYF